MYTSDGMSKIVDELEYLVAEQRQLRARGPHFRIIHRYSQQFSPCGDHEEIAAVYLIHAGRVFQVRLGTTLSYLFDYLARHNQLAQTARQIERGTRSSRLQRGNSASASRKTRSSGIPRRYVRVYVDRIRAALAIALRSAGLENRPATVLVSEETTTNETRYCLHGTFEWLHTKN